MGNVHPVPRTNPNTGFRVPAAQTPRGRLKNTLETILPKDLTDELDSITRPLDEALEALLGARRSRRSRRLALKALGLSRSPESGVFSKFRVDDLLEVSLMKWWTRGLPDDGPYRDLLKASRERLFLTWRSPNGYSACVYTFRIIEGVERLAELVRIDPERHGWYHRTDVLPQPDEEALFFGDEEVKSLKDILNMMPRAKRRKFRQQMDPSRQRLDHTRRAFTTYEVRDVLRIIHRIK